MKTEVKKTLFVRKIRRWIMFHLQFKTKLAKSHGIPLLCSNVIHPYHESKFEASTCDLLSQFFKKSQILCPQNHGYKIKFDFIIKYVAIVEPYGN